MWASPKSRWCIRKIITEPKYSGNIDSPSLCGRVIPPTGSDIKVPITEAHLKNMTCERCLALYVSTYKV